MAIIKYSIDRQVLNTIENESILECSLRNEIPHKHACGGKARCSTCRVLILEGLENCPPRNEAEEKLALSKGLEANIRLACQTIPTGTVHLRRLVMDEEDEEIARTQTIGFHGKEKEIAVLFSDIRGFTTFSENNLPYDVIHILNRYFKKIGDVILTHNGYIDKYIGDGIMVLFGASGNLSKEQICENAILSALDMLSELKKLNEYLSLTFETKFSIGIGIHFGEVILGEIGHPSKVQMTAIGDNVNLASRIEQATKSAKAELLVSEEVKQILGERLQIGRRFKTEIKGKKGIYKLTEVLGLTSNRT